MKRPIVSSAVPGRSSTGRAAGCSIPSASSSRGGESTVARIFTKFRGARVLVVGIAVVAALLSAKGHGVHYHYGFFDGPG